MRFLDTAFSRLGTQVLVAGMALMSMLAIGTVSYRYIEGWSWVDSFYFTVATLTTVGYGDLYPTNESSRLFTAVFALVGVSMALASFGIIGTAYLRARELQLTRMLSENRLH